MGSQVLETRFKGVSGRILRVAYWPLWVMGAVLVAYLVGLAMHDGGFSPLTDGLLASLALWVPAGVCWIAAYRTGFHELQAILTALALTSFAVGNTIYIIALAGERSLPFPSLSDIAFLGFYPLIFGALIALVRRLRRGFDWRMLLDSVVGSLGASAILAVLIGPVLASATASGAALSALVAVAYPLFDLLLVAAIAGIVAAHGVAVGRHGTLLTLGLLVFTVADVTYALRVTTDSYVIGTPLDAVWAIGLYLIATWAIQTAQPKGRAERSAPGAWSLAVPAASTVAGLGILIIGTQTPVLPLAVVLAGCALVVAMIRTQLAFRQLLRMADFRLQSRTDDLTGLPNRRALLADLSERLAAGHPRRGALLLLDLDRFKEVNDSMGHEVGDRLLVQVSLRLARYLPTDSMLARLGGDEFAVFLDRADQGEAEAVALTLRAALAAPFRLHGISLQTDASVGIALFPHHGDDLGTLLRMADMAMYKAKSSRSGFRVYSNADDTHGAVRLRTLDELRVALRDDQLVLHYQPKVDLDSGDVLGVEALVRWNHPDRGLLYPDAFLVLAEDAGLMPALTEVVLGKALDQAAAWRTDDRPLSVAVNLSASALIDAGIPTLIGGMLDARQLPASVLMLEITESFLMVDFPRARAILARLRSQGIRIAVDDFGTGYSSLAYLRDLPIDELKLDRSFVTPMADDRRAAALVASTIDLAHSLDLRVVAEGVEDSGAYADLARLGCDEAQGYYLCKAVPATQLDDWLASRRATATAQ